MIVMLRLFGLVGGWYIQECDLCVVIVGIFGYIVFSVVISICSYLFLGLRYISFTNPRISD